MEYQCSCCGGISKTKFYKSYSVLNKYRMVQAICKDCLIEIYKDLVNEYKSEDKALYRLCMLLDVYYDEKMVVTCKEKSKESGKDLPLEYMPKLSLKQYANKSFIDSNKMELNEKKIVGNEDVKKEEKSTKKNKKSVVTPEMIQRWGDNLEENDYLFLEERFKMMCDTYDNKNIANIWQYQEIALNYLQIQKLRALDDEKSTATAIKLMDSTSKMMNDCKMKSTQLDGSGDLDVNLPGIWAKRIQNEDPIPQAEGVFADVDRIQELFDNQFVKPMRRVLGVGD
ncbi:Uncharacterised protein [[Clostridium] sordellii]|uniref:hypothetical protein n=1 Tax=Paraclostridium sordellii TaxID=1505 RepID=UPI0005E02C87|nr:hypothetical protein [Paeniclostridium sordellii]CEQ01719.1 Uncharacterised protein [[Clostridium] sordellii] [Paeniclostridium sordellii]